MDDHLDRPLRDVLAHMQRRIMGSTSYLGVKMRKCPLDAWVYQEIVAETRPDVIVEVGNYHGGGLLYFAHLCDAIGTGHVLGVDKSHRLIAQQVRAHPRVTLVEGDAVASFDRVRELVPQGARVLVVEDSAHTFDTTLGVLRHYGELLQVGDYLVVEDTICHHGLALGPRPGPREAVEAFLQESTAFVADRRREGFAITWNALGYLRRV